MMIRKLMLAVVAGALAGEQTCWAEVSLPLDIRAVGAVLHEDSLQCVADESGRMRFALEIGFPSWEADTYVMLPAAAYDGNRPFVSIPVHSSGSMWFRDEDLGTNCPCVLNARVPSMGRDGTGSLEGGVGDLATPAACFFFPKARKGVIVHFEPTVAGRYTGFYVTNGLFRVQYPARQYDLLQRRSAKVDDPPLAVRPGATICSNFRVQSFVCADVPALYEEYFRSRKSFLPGERAVLPSAHDYDYLVKLTANQIATSTWYGSPDAHEVWVSGWCGGPTYVAALLRVGFQGARDMASETLDFMADTQDAFGMFRGKSKDGKPVPERQPMPETVRFHLTRRSADGLYWAFELMRSVGATPKREAALRRCADAFLKLLDRYGSIPEYVEAGTGECLVGGTTGAAILPAALVRAAEYFKEPRYLVAAQSVCERMCRDDLSRGLCFGAAGDAGNAPDSESCAALLRSCVSLAERTGEAKWIEWARQSAHVLSTWVVSYRFPFPPTSEFGRLNVNSVGSVVANLQNRHAAPGFCIDDGDSLLRLAKLTGDARYRELYEDVRAFMPQVISTPERPVFGKMWTREPYQVAFGAMHERVNLSGWEGMESVGETYWRGTWCMASFLLMQPTSESRK